MNCHPRIVWVDLEWYWQQIAVGCVRMICQLARASTQKLCVQKTVIKVTMFSLTKEKHQNLCLGWGCELTCECGNFNLHGLIKYLLDFYESAQIQKQTVQGPRSERSDPLECPPQAAACRQKAKQRCLL